MSNEVQPTILVTGFGPFQNHKINASWEAVKLLPDLFSKHEKSPGFKLVIEEIPVIYKDVAQRVRELWKEHKPLIILHVGVSHLAKCLEIECQACSKGYNKPDIIQSCPIEEDIMEETLKTEFDIQKICRIVNESSHKTGCKASMSSDAGRYLCEYIYYNSLSLKEPQVLFVHVPDLDTYPSIKTAQGLLEIIIHLTECVFDVKCTKL
ncbi:pyroglutamyl-peptidase 1 [Phymastichus coffea]|uniref:pyroglutamyl-peptidase 1 n=1 Tax=Phymastichus coffea TaxID=108790 RepID=UPI00273AD882|nr:pyroglutamyl-peptidase 1 [Phymastichus coffea]